MNLNYLFGIMDSEILLKKWIYVLFIHYILIPTPITAFIVNFLFVIQV